MSFAKITGTGVYIPEKILSNKDLESMVDTSDEWIKTRTGISERRIFSLLKGDFGLPEFLIKNPGLNSGFMMLQVTVYIVVQTR